MKYDLDNIFNYIKQTVTRYPGVFPTLREVSIRFGMNSTSVARNCLKALVAEGRLKEYGPGRYYIPDLHLIGESVTVEKLPPNGDHNKLAIIEHYRRLKKDLLAA